MGGICKQNIPIEIVAQDSSNSYDRDYRARFSLTSSTKSGELLTSNQIISIDSSYVTDKIKISNEVFEKLDIELEAKLEVIYEQKSNNGWIEKSKTYKTIYISNNCAEQASEDSGRESVEISPRG